MNRKKEVYSPCISVCTIEDDTGFCRGCFRSLNEITNWNSYNNGDRNAILKELEKRRVIHGNAHLSPYST